jgi:hypothetical protein
MPVFDIVFLSFVVACFSLFGIVLAGTAWYCRDRPAKVARARAERTRSAQDLDHTAVRGA